MVTHRERFSMVPERLIGACPHCVALFAVLDLEQGQQGVRPFRGRRALARTLGWSHNTVDTHLRHLMSARLVTKVKDGNRKVVYRVTNPARHSVSATDTRVCQQVTRFEGDSVSATDTLPSYLSVSSSNRNHDDDDPFPP